MNTAYNDNNICSTTAISSGSVTVWSCFSFGCKLDMHVVEVYMNIEIYRDLVFRDIVAPHFDNHKLVTRLGVLYIWSHKN